MQTSAPITLTRAHKAASTAHSGGLPVTASHLRLAPPPQQRKIESTRGSPYVQLQVPLAADARTLSLYLVRLVPNYHRGRPVA